MHAGAFNFVKHSLEGLPKRLKVIEYGGRYINGSIRPLFDTPSYISIDLVSGPGVDVVADAAQYKPSYTPDTVVCCEVLEHSKKWADIIKAAGRILKKPEGVLILTCACPNRAPHSAVDGGGVRDDEYYGNVDPLELSTVLESAGFKSFDLEVDTVAGDLYVIARIKVDE